MRTDKALDLYKKHYIDLWFERTGLLQAIKKKYGCVSALYPGSLFHIAPSFFFPHVVYVDQSPLTREFFADTAGVLHHIDRNKKHKRSPEESKVTELSKN